MADPGGGRRGGSSILGRGGLITIFTSGGGYGGGVPSPVIARGSREMLIVPPVGILSYSQFVLVLV